jgi:glycosyltransferase involved in cell wall biosynthesis
LASDGTSRPGRPTVSIVVINHNYARFLKQAIDSALDQTCPADEVIVFDDGSSDGSREIIESYGERVHPVLNGHVGLIEAFNRAAALAAGEVVFFLDADDYLYPDCLAEVLAEWRPDLSKVQFQLDTVDSEGTDQAMPFPYFPSDLDEKAVFEQCVRYGTYPWTVRSGNAYASAFLRQVLPMDPQAIFKAPDGYVNKLAPLFGGVRSLSRRLGAYRVHGQNVWAQSGGTFRIKPIVDNVRLDVAMHEVFRRYAAQRGYEIASFDDICVPNQVEIRLLACRFSDETGAPQELARLTRIGARAIDRAPNLSPLGKQVWRLWFWLIRTAPLPVVEQLHLRLRSQSGRSVLVRRAARLVRGSARVAA